MDFGRFMLSYGKNHHNVQFSSIQSLSRVRLFATPWVTARQASLSITSSQSSPKLMSIKLVTPSDHLILCWTLLLLPSILPSIRVFSKKSVLRITWSKYQSFSFSIGHSNEHSRLISFRTGWFDLLASKRLWRVFSSTTIQKHQLFVSHLSLWPNSHIHTWLLEKPLTRWTFVSKVMSLFFNMLSRLAIDFLPRSKHLLISGLQSSSSVILELKKIKSLTVSPSICPKWWDWMPWS